MGSGLALQPQLVPWGAGAVPSSCSDEQPSLGRGHPGELCAPVLVSWVRDTYRAGERSSGAVLESFSEKEKLFPLAVIR